MSEVITTGLSSSIQYKGRLDILVKDGSTIRERIQGHNAGLPALANYLRDSLLGVETSMSAPRNIKAARLVDDELVPMFNLGYPYSYKTPVEGELNATAAFKFIIPWTYLEANTAINGFILTNNKDENCAEFKLESPISVRSNTNLEVIWYLEVVI